MDGVWSPWEPWGECSRSCGGGEQFRIRDCLGMAYGGLDCNGTDIESQPCLTQLCPGISQEYEKNFVEVKQ